MQHTQQSGSSVTPPLEQMGDEVSVSIPNPRFRGTPLAHLPHLHTLNTFKALTSLQKHTSLFPASNSRCALLFALPPQPTVYQRRATYTQHLYTSQVSVKPICLLIRKKKFISATSAFCRHPKLSQRTQRLLALGGTLQGSASQLRDARRSAT